MPEDGATFSRSLPTGPMSDSTDAPLPPAPGEEPLLRGYVFTTYDRLLERLPSPDPVAAEGSTVHWTLDTSFGPLMIYDRHPDGVPRRPYLWHVAAANPLATGFVTALVGEHFTPLLSGPPIERLV